MSTSPRFKVESAKTGRLSISSAGTARQAFVVALEELEQGSPAVAIACDEGFSELLEAFAAVPDVDYCVVIKPYPMAWDGLVWRFDFSPAEVPFLQRLVEVAPRSAGVALELPFDGLEWRPHAR